MSEVVAIEYDVNIGGNGIVITYYADGNYSIAGLSLGRVSDEHPTGEDPKELSAQHASAVGKAETQYAKNANCSQSLPIEKE